MFLEELRETMKNLGGELVSWWTFEASTFEYKVGMLLPCQHKLAITNMCMGRIQVKVMYCQ
jgi:hypothetical protein